MIQGQLGNPWPFNVVVYLSIYDSEAG